MQFLVFGTFYETIFVYVFECFTYMYICMYTVYMPGTHEGQKRTWIPLEVELGLAVSCHAGPLQELLNRLCNLPGTGFVVLVLHCWAERLIGARSNAY